MPLTKYLSASTALALYFRPDLSILRPAVKSWANVLNFGGYNGVSFVINRIYESLPSLVLGYLLPHAAVGLYNRASVVSDIPDKVVLTSVFSVAFPALAAEVREGRSLKEPYLRSLGLITVFYWPAQVLLALRFPDPSVRLTPPVGAGAGPAPVTEEEKARDRDMTAPRPAFGNITENLAVLLSQNVPIVVARSADAATDRTVTVEVKAEILK